MTSTDIVVQDDLTPVASTLFGTDDPVAVIEKAANVAKPLADLIRRQKLAVNISGREHVRVEGWTLLGSMLGVFPFVEWTRPVRDDEGSKVGWEARVIARTRGGEIVGAGEAECLRDEKTWKGRDDYALRSMAQTRAVSKALRLPLGFVMQLAGFDPTPLDEMPRDTLRHAEGEPVDDGKFPPPDDAPIAVQRITEPQRVRLRAIQKECGVSDDTLKKIVALVAGVQSSKDIPAVRYEALVAAVQQSGAALEAAEGESQFRIPEKAQS